MGRRKDSVIIHDNVRIMLESMPSDAARGQFIMGLLGYGLDGEVPSFEGADPSIHAAMVACFKICRPFIDENHQKYLERCEINRRNIEKRWNREAAEGSSGADTNGYDGIDSNTSENEPIRQGTDYDYDSEMDSELENENSRGIKHASATNYEILKRQVESVYRDLEGEGETLLPLENTFRIIASFYWEYEKVFGTPHVRYRNANLSKIIRKLPSDGENDFTLREYGHLIPAYFKQSFEKADYLMLHFLSGSIRKNLIDWGLA